MATSVGDFKLASTAAGFTLGFGVLTVWNAVQQTRAVKAPHRSVYIYMVWGEIVANLVIGVVGWLFLDGFLQNGVPVLFTLLFCWVFEVQLLMQIIINRIQVVVEDRKKIWRVKWGTALIITLINIAVFTIWIPAHLVPAPIPILVKVNTYWDRTSKVIILLVDASLNYYFLHTVKQRLVQYHGLTKYAPLVRFNARLMVLSILMDLMLICLMSLKNQLVYIQFHPVAYMVKLNIEMSMAALITKLARNSVESRNEFVIDSSHSHTRTFDRERDSVRMKTGTHTSAVGRSRAGSKGREEGSVDFGPGSKYVIRKDVDVIIETAESTKSESEEEFPGTRKDSVKDDKGSEDKIPFAGLGSASKTSRTEAWE